MKERTVDNKDSKPKNFLARFFEKLDQKMKEKADSSKCCCPGNKKDNSCCS
ncbi:MAG: hypothetical protein NT088_03940 [Candidatus Omnitrophica bacterium]|nr:hypothetical protein [Candidatus Omnitrophota bacterium]